MYINIRQDIIYSLSNVWRRLVSDRKKKRYKYTWMNNIPVEAFTQWHSLLWHFFRALSLFFFSYYFFSIFIAWTIFTFRKWIFLTKNWATNLEHTQQCRSLLYNQKLSGTNRTTKMWNKILISNMFDDRLDLITKV